MEKQSSRIRILLADSQTIFRVGLRSRLAQEADMEIVGEASDGRQALRLAGALKPDILLLALSMRAPAAVEVLRELGASPEVRTLVLASAGEKSLIAEAFRLGARGQLLKDSSVAMLIQAIRSVMKGAYWAGGTEVEGLAAVIRLLAAHVPNSTPSKTFGLTRRELEIVAEIVSGYSNREIADKLSISEYTVKHHVTNIFDKVGVYNRLELALFAIHHGLVGKSE